MADRSKHTFGHLQMSQVNVYSPEQLIKYTPAQQAINNSWKFNIKRCMFIIFILISSSILISQINAEQKIQIEPRPFQNLVYCPYSYVNKITPLFEGDELRRLYQSQYSYKISLLQELKDATYDWNSTYVVQMRSREDDSAVKAKLQYCGLATSFYSTFDKFVKFVCSSPGPMFDLKVNKHTDIVWINNLNPHFVPTNSCMTNSTPHCQLLTKAQKDSDMTFTDPTDVQHQNMIDSIQIGPSNWPTSTHVHGAEVRPTFDGNPLSWIDNGGNRGVGAFSLADHCYYQSFDQVDEQQNNYLPPQIIVKDIQKDYTLTHVKINRYPNIQNPGNLWYHDHAMRLTLFNVQYGLSGNYILRDDAVETQIGIDRNNQNIVMMTTQGWNTSQSISLDTDTVYRFKFLNNNFDRDSIFKVTFKYGDCSNQQLIPFTIIGADSSLFNQGIQGQTSFIIAQAERIELLIILGNQDNKYSICTQFFLANKTNSTHMNGPKRTESLNLQNNDLVQKIQSKKTNQNNRTSINNISLPVPFVSFKDKGHKVAVKRMRPLMRVAGTSFTINARHDFHAGRSQNPKIGTYEDWYIINSIGLYHPIHIHLINFQIVNIMSLRKVGNCTLYELDFIAQAMKIGKLQSQFGDIFTENYTDYNQLCSRRQEIKVLENFNDFLQQVNLEDEKDQNNVSGIDVQKQLTTTDRQIFKQLSIPLAEGQARKYVTDQINQIKPYYQRWKDTALVEEDKVFVFRIRWAKSAYKDDNTQNDPYFHVPIDQLREYPGFVYHCHILNHEDNEMMRPIMLQLPDDTSQINQETPCNNDPNDFSWDSKVKCLNKKCFGSPK